jgi:hypothetical protein
VTTPIASTVSIVMFNRTANHDWLILAMLLSGLASCYFWICAKAYQKMTS